jgi:hypothetical protein
VSRLAKALALDDGRPRVMKGMDGSTDRNDFGRQIANSVAVCTTNDWQCQRLEDGTDQCNLEAILAGGKLCKGCFRPVLLHEAVGDE